MSTDVERTLSVSSQAQVVPPRFGFLGVGWIGRQRMEAIARSGLGTVVAIVDESAATARDAQASVPGARVLSSFDELLDERVDGIVIATPSALHAAQAVAALRSGAAVFCQKPLARTAEEAGAVIDAAREADRLLAIDLSYRFTRAARVVRDLVQSGEIGDVFAIDLVFHNAYGPDKAWARDPSLAGGGCVIDLGVHLVDLAMWVLDRDDASGAAGQLYALGAPVRDAEICEDYATARFTLGDATDVRLACSWWAHAGQPCTIEATFHGTRGTASMINVDGSFYDFIAERRTGATRTTLANGDDAWGARAALDWTRRLAAGERFDPSVEDAVSVSRVLDGIYGRASQQWGTR